MIDSLRLQVLLDVLARAPITRAEQLIIQELVDQLLAESTPRVPPAPGAESRAEGSA
jgi:hypothetical protein